ncbi:hypothetical protein K435DRAFT_697686 [Dendrothele bispora CBS 962.96]|uniref:Uncharacterized protein n=1 Tax=Dendrothele bispora (strain CBS 962.96) TaxID=1314807 RepID=A0A4S8KUM7_DENBC|nr:hypothetical protein K435DRAFT_697686 [Dendrothele bispora CBS 962.96]
MSPRDPELAALLKDEGNELFSNKKYGAAEVKYTKALELDDTNATIWANRAACRLSTKSFFFFLFFFVKATELDPGYSKAYARVASAHDALGEPWKSTGYWQKALDNLPKGSLTPAEQTQRGTYEAALASAERTLEAFENSKNSGSGPSHKAMVYHQGETGGLPWHLAFDILPQLTLEGDQKSSVSCLAWLITNAHLEFNTGLDMMSFAVRCGGMMVVRMGTLEQLSNAVLKDSRCFCISNPNFIKNYNDQVITEAASSGAWKDAGPDVIMKEAPERLRRDGWSKLRSALSVTIRSWIMRGFLDGGLRQNYTTKMEFLSNAVKLIKWGQKEWANVPTSNCGVIFRESFLRAVRRMYFEAMLGILSNIPRRDAEYRSSILKQMFEEAEEVIKSVDSEPLPPYDGPDGPSWRLAFFEYPKGDAYAAKGRYYAELGNVSCDAAEKSRLYEKSGEMYVLAADCLPEDEENHALYLGSAISNFIMSQVQIGTMLNIIERIKVAYPKAMKIWKNSTLARQGLGKICNHAMGHEKNLRKLLAKGVINNVPKKS